MVGDIVLVDSGDEIDCSRMGSGGYGIPSIVEPEVIQFKKCDAKFILHVEKDTVWQRFNEDKFWRKHNCILTHGGGQPPRGVRRLLHRLHNELKLPVYCLLDNDPVGILHLQRHQAGLDQPGLRVAADGDSRRAVLGLRSKDFERCELSDSVKITLNDTDRKRAKQIANYPWFAHKKAWQKEIKRMLGQRLQAGSRSADQQGHQLRHRAICARPAGRAGFSGLSGSRRACILVGPASQTGPGTANNP